MRNPLALLGAGLLAMLITSAPVEAQTTRAVPLGSNDTAYGIYYDEAANLAYLSGNTVPVATELPMVWSITSTNVVTPIPLGLLPGDTTGDAYTFSPDGTYLAGQGDSTAYLLEGIRWTSGVWTATGTGTAGAAPTSGAAGVANNGLVCGTGGNAWYWAPITQLPGLNPTLNFSLATAIDSDGSVIVGGSLNTSFVSQACQWVWNGSTYVVSGLADPFGVSSTAISVSADGSLITGAIQTATDEHAALWDNGVLNIVPDDTGANLSLGIGRWVRDDGTVFGTGDFGFGPQAFIWTENMGGNSKTLDDYYQENNNNVPPPTSFIDVRQVSQGDGSYHIVARGANGLDYYVEVPEDAGCTCTPLCQLLCWISNTWYGGNPPLWLQWYLLRFGCDCNCCG